MRFTFLAACVFFDLHLSSQSICDSSQFKISGAKAAQIACKEEYDHWMRISRLEVKTVKDSCRWYVLMASVGTIHHGYYSTSYHEYEIDANSGTVVRRGGYKKLGDKVPVHDKDLIEQKKRKK